MARKTFTLACVLTGAVFLADAALAARSHDPFARTWKCTMVRTGNPAGKVHVQVLKLRNEYGRLGGTITIGRTVAPVTDLRVRDDSIAFRVKGEQTHINRVYRGTLTDGEIHGTMTIRRNNEVFTYDWTAQPAR